MSALPLTAIVLTRNEQTHIGRCLESLRFCDQVVVVDSDSTDATVETARSKGAEVVNLPWAGFTAQRNQALDFARHAWVFSVDADEVVTPELEREIRALFARGNKAAAYTLPRKTIHFGRWIRHGGWYPNRLVRLFDKGRGSWEGGELHEKWVTTGTVGALASDLLHYSFDDLADQVSRNNRYSSLGAEKLRRQGKVFTFLRLLTKPTSKFLETYLLKRGFLDGYPGFIISVSAAYSVFLKWAKLWEMQNGQEEV